MEGWSGVINNNPCCCERGEEVVKKEKFEFVRDIAEDDGFAYAFVHYSDWQDIDDSEFHKKRKAFLNALKNLRTYIGMHESEIK